jgi:hypothetical protein
MDEGAKKLIEPLESSVRGQQQTANTVGGPSRIKGREALYQRANRLRREASLLSELARAIPENFPPDADEALFNFATQRRFD